MAPKDCGLRGGKKEEKFALPSSSLLLKLLVAFLSSLFVNMRGTRLWSAKLSSPYFPYNATLHHCLAVKNKTTCSASCNTATAPVETPAMIPTNLSPL